MRIAPAGRAYRGWRWPLAIIAAAGLVAGATACTSHPDTIRTHTALASQVFLAPGLTTKTHGNLADKKVTITFDVKNVGSVPVDIAKVDVGSRPGMRLVSAKAAPVRLAPGKAVTVALTYVITNCEQAMSATGSVPVIVNVATGTVTRMVDPITQNPNESWERFAAQQVCEGPTLTQTSP